MYVGERSGKFAHLTDDASDIDEIHTIFAGKFRRYHGESWLHRLLDVKTLLLNIRDLLFFVIGMLQGLVLMRNIKPDVVLLKGGFVGVPVGLSAAFWRQRFVTHDSDPIPGLANRIVSRWAAYHATGLPVTAYDYPKHKARFVGVITGSAYQPVSAALQAQYKDALKLPPNSRLLLVTGGSLGARRLNQAVRALVPGLLESFSDLHIIHQVGKGQLATYQGMALERLRVLEFLQPMYRYTGAADIVVTRAGANTLAELAVQGKACVVVPNPLLTGGHQLKNAERYAKSNAIVVVDEAAFKTSTEKLDRAIRGLLEDNERRISLGRALQAASVPDAARQLAVLLLEAAERKNPKP